jgi:type VI secretion system protein ImpJ
MSSYNRVVWSEGLFLQPQHLQQQDRYLERYVETRCHGLIAHAWGFTEVEIERDFLSIGKLGLRRAAGVFPDGTPFRMPEDDPLPAPIDVDVQMRDQLVSLAVPLRRGGDLEVSRDGDGDRLARHQIREWQVRDATSTSGESTVVEVGALSTRLLPSAEVTDAYATVPLAHVLEARPDKRVILDEAFMPTVMHTRAATRLATFATELLGLLHQRGDALGGRVAATGRGAAAEFAEFLMLQAINRYEPLVAHYADGGGVHPEQFYELCVTIAGEMATFTTVGKRPAALPGYRHERLRESFDPVIAALRAAFATEMMQVAIPIPLEPKKYGISVALVPDRSLYSQAVFILAARAEVPSEELRRSFPAQLKVGPVERIADLVRLGLPGVPVLPLPVAPRQIPFHAGFAYFELDQSNELWDQLKSSGGVALHVAGNFPSLAMEFWAIRT